MLMTYISLLLLCIITARKRSLGQSNVFTGMCHSVHGGGLCMMSLPLWLTGPMFLQGGSLSLVPCSFQVGGGLCPGGSLSKGGSLSVRPPPIRILLESFLVMKMVSKMFFCKCVSTFHNSKIMSRGNEFGNIAFGLTLPFLCIDHSSFVLPMILQFGIRVKYKLLPHENSLASLACLLACI